MALTLLQIATRIACIPTSSYVISSYSNVRLQQPSVGSQMLIDDIPRMLDSMLLNDELTLPSTTVAVIDEMEIDDNETLKKKLIIDEKIEISQQPSTTIIKDIKKEEEVTTKKQDEEGEVTEPYVVDDIVKNIDKLNESKISVIIEIKEVNDGVVIEETKTENSLPSEELSTESILTESPLEIF